MSAVTLSVTGVDPICESLGWRERIGDAGGYEVLVGGGDVWVYIPDHRVRMPLAEVSKVLETSWDLYDCVVLKY